MSKQENFGIIAGYVFRDESLSIEAKAIYGYLSTFADKDGMCNPSVSRICRELGIGQARFYKHMKKLTDVGVVSVKPVRDGTRFAKNCYIVVRPSVSPSLEKSRTEKQGTEDNFHSSDFPSLRIPSTGKGGVNSTTITRTNVLNRTNKNIYDQICDLLNEGKRKARSKGRIKPSGAQSCVSGIEAKGMSKNDILKAAQEVAGAGMDLDWFSFSEYCLKR